MTEHPLEGIRIIDFTWAWAGPYANLLLAFLGAEVIKVESRQRLDHTRLRSLMTGPTMGGPNQSVGFNNLNLNKLSVTLNLTKPKSIEIVKRLVKVADVVTENMRPGVMERLGLSYEALQDIKPDIIMLSSSALGGTGPERTYAGYAPTFCAMSGLAYASGFPDGAPNTLSGAIDTRVGTTSAFAILAALNYRQRTGRGQFIDLSSTEAINCLAGHLMMDYTMNRSVTQRHGNLDESMAPHNCYPCLGTDRWVTIAISTEEEWQAFCQVMGHPAWSQDNRFGNAQNRWQNRDELDKLVAEWTSQHADYEVTELLQKVGITAAPTLDGEMVYKDIHSKERDLFVTIQHPEIGKRLVVAPPWKFSGTPARTPRAAPLLGEHNQYVLGELLGMSQQEIDELIKEQVVY
jgi:benzylsuccinate CoA-transferase BbsF subunit